MFDLEEQLIDVQTRVAYQEDTLVKLNDVITKQDAEIVQLKQHVRLLAHRLDELALDSSQGGDNEITNEKPPHY